MATRQANKPISVKLETEQPAQEIPAQPKLPDTGRFRLHVDRQAKSSYSTLEAAEEAGAAIKKKFPIVQVAVYDRAESQNKIIELPKL